MYVDVRLSLWYQKLDCATPYIVILTLYTLWRTWLPLSYVFQYTNCLIHTPQSNAYDCVASVLFNSKI